MDAINKRNADAANALSKEAFKGKGFLPIPGMAIGMPEFDGGERFDLRAPYADEGWVDTEVRQCRGEGKEREGGERGVKTGGWRVGRHV